MLVEAVLAVSSHERTSSVARAVVSNLSPGHSSSTSNRIRHSTGCELWTQNDHEKHSAIIIEVCFLLPSMTIEVLSSHTCIPSIDV